ncbi:hypothetical protein TrVGV298_008698 [Trichoderma virens]|nr:hypothetical protein TrVGV298_008698 [Trichoderma virens]
MDDRGGTQELISHNTFGDNAHIHQGNVHISTNYAATPQESKLDYLPASFDAESKQHIPGCLQHTREQILSDIHDWIDHESEKRIYWLSGMAGTGKSTISLTIAREYYKRKQLGASFFFSRGGGDLASTKKFATTMAAQLAEHSLVLRQHIMDAFASNARIDHLALYNQWEKLIMEPLRLLESNSIQSPLLIIVDALDECDNERDMVMLIECFASIISTVKKIPLRIFVTSRPDRPIDLGFEGISVSSRQHFALHSIEQAIVDGDLEIYYRHQLTQISQRHCWNDNVISDEVIHTLVQKSHGLFIYAATACRFINEGGILAEERLLNLCATGPSTFEAEKGLDSIYNTVLENSFSEQLDPGEVAILQQKFQKVVGSILVLFDTFTLSDIVNFIKEPKTRVISILNKLKSVLDFAEDDGKQIDILHPSFRDFLLDSRRCSNQLFGIFTKQVHYDLFERCLAIMHGFLHKDMCKLKKPGVKARDVSKAQVDQHIPLSVQYACSYWMRHLQQSGQDWKSHEGMVDFFRADFLGWLEVLALLGRLSEGMTMLSELRSLLEDIPDEENSSLSFSRFLEKLRWPRAKAPNTVAKVLGELIRDAKRFAYYHSRIIEEAPLQLYCSALLFSPEQSLIRQIYHDQVPNWITASFERRDTWPTYTQILWHPPGFISFVFSPDGKYLASGCDDGTVWLWDVVTGANQRILRGHSDCVNSVAISPDSQLIASASWDRTIRLWNSTTGAFQDEILSHDHTAWCHDRSSCQVAFSPDGASLVLRSTMSAIGYSNISLWNIVTHATNWQCRVLDYVSDVVFLSDGKRLVYSTRHETGLLDSRTGQTVSKGQMMGLATKTHVELYDIQSSARRWRVRVAYAHVLTSPPAYAYPITFSPDDRLIAAYLKGRIELLDVASSHTRHIIECQLDDLPFVRQIKFSSDGTFLASSWSDNTIRFWDMPRSRQQLVSCSEPPQPQYVTTSECGKFIALMPPYEVSKLHSSKVQVYIWDTQGMRMAHTFSLSTQRRVEYMMLSPNSQFLAIQWEGSHYDLFECKTGTSVFHSKNADDRNRHIFSPDNKLLVLLTRQDSMQIWDIQKRATIYEIQVTRLRRMAFSLDSKLIAAIVSDEQLYVFDLEASGHLTKVERNFIFVTNMQFTHENRLLVANGWNPSRTEVLDIHTGRTLRVFHPNNDARSYGGEKYRKIIFQTADIIVTSDGGDFTVEVWDLETGELRISLEWNKKVKNIHLLPCKAHLLINEVIVPLSRPDSSTCCSNRVWIERLYFKRGEEQLVFVPQDYASALIAVRDEGASFQPFDGRAWGMSASSQLINTLKFDFSVNEGFV